MLRIASCSLIILAAAGAPWLLGGYSQWCYLLAPLITLAAVILWLPSRGAPGISVTSWSVIVASALLVGYVWLQAIPLPTRALRTVAADSRIERLEALASSGEACEASETNASREAPRWNYISSDPPETRRQWLIVATAFAICILAMSLAGDERCRLLMVFALPINGALFGLVAIVQRASAPREIYWTIKPQWDSLPFGAFVNRNHAGLFLALSALCALFGICLLLSRRLVKQRPSDTDYPAARDRSIDLTELRMIWMSQKDSVLLPLAFCALFCAVSSVVAASRSGAIAFGMVIIISALMLFIAGADRRLIGVLGVLGAIAAVISSAKLDYLIDRFKGDAIEAGFMSRFSHWKDVLDQYPEYALTGVGFGSYAYSTLPYLSQPSASWYQHADNQYVEVFVELGIFGVALVACVIGALSIRCITLLRSKDAQSRIVGLFGVALIGIGAINSLSDFALVMAGVLLPMALATGVVLGHREPSSEKLNEPPLKRIGGFFLKASVALLVGWATLLGMAHFSHGSPQTDGKQHLLQWAARAASNRLGEPNLHALAQDAEAATGRYIRQVENAVNSIDRGLLTSDDYSLENLAMLQRALAGQDTATEFQELQSALQLHEPLKTARQRRLAMLKFAPMRFDNQLAIARLDLHLCPGPSVSHWINHARVLHPTSAVDASKAGIVSIINGDMDSGGQMLAQALRAAPEWEREIYSVLRSQLNVQELVKYVLKNDAALMIRAADHYYSAPQDWAARSYLYSQLRRLIESGDAKALSKGEIHYYLAKSKYMTGDRQGAYVDFENACKEEPSNLPWLRELASIYQKEGKIREALRILKTMGQEFGYDEKLQQQIDSLEKQSRQRKH